MAEGHEEIRPAFGTRCLSDPDKVFEHNAWDHVEWGDELEAEARVKVEENSSLQVPDHVREEHEEKAGAHWDAFYHQHKNRFFKDRHWLFTEFPELKGSTAGEGEFTMLEVGCGAGNTVFPILQVNTNPHLFIHCCDFAESAIKIVKDHSLYDVRRCHAFHCDITDSSQSLPIPEASVDILIMIFVLSAIAPDQYSSVIARLVRFLRPGGMLLFRDYGELDMAQLRFKKGQCLSGNFYARGDGTRVYFFSEREVEELFSGAGLKREQLHVDRRLQVNRGKQLKMYRVWIQAKYSKTHCDTQDTPP